MNGLFQDIGLQNSFFAIADSNLSTLKLKNSIQNNYPVLVGTTNHPTFNNHWLIAYGYHIISGLHYFEMNDGWGKNDVFASAQESHYGAGMVYIG